ncbi:MAG: hypothetical protein HS111_24580 [Kofleriaceae bacterium]|nr:hypothetical protein [Kofleriaceae bacterium]
MVPDGDDVARLGCRDGLPGRGVLALARLRDGRIVAGTSSGAVLVGDGALPVGPPGTRIGNVGGGRGRRRLAVARHHHRRWRGPATAEAGGAAALAGSAWRSPPDTSTTTG